MFVCLRISGTGVSYRAKHDTYVYRSPKLWLSDKHLEGHGGPRQRSLVTGDGGSPPVGPYSNGPADDSAAVVRSPFSTGDDHGKVPEPGEPKAVVADSGDPERK